MELHTDDFPLSLNRKFYDYLIENFKSIEQEESQLRDDLNDETDARISADSDERNARINGDINERNSRINADNIEHDARIESDGRLQSQIDAIIQRLDKNENNIADLQTRMKAAEEQIKQLNETVYGMPSALLNEASSVDDEENDNQPLQEINTERNGILDAQ